MLFVNILKDKKRNLCLFLAAFTATYFFIFSISFLNYYLHTHDKDWYKFLQEQGTLVGGFFSLLAAVWTIRVTIKSSETSIKAALLANVRQEIRDVRNTIDCLSNIIETIKMIEDDDFDKSRIGGICAWVTHISKFVPENKNLSFELNKLISAILSRCKGFSEKLAKKSSLFSGTGDLDEEYQDFAQKLIELKEMCEKCNEKLVIALNKLELEIR